MSYIKLSLLFLIVSISYMVNGQEQVSNFSSDLVNRYNIGELYYSNSGDLRYALEENSGEVYIYEFQENTFELLDILNSSPLSAPVLSKSKINDSYLVQVYEDRLLAYDLQTLDEITILKESYMSDKSLLIGHHFIQRTEYSLFEVSDLLSLEIDTIYDFNHRKLRPFEDSHLMNIEDDVLSIIDLETFEIDTLAANQGSVTFASADDYISIDSNFHIVRTNPLRLDSVFNNLPGVSHGAFDVNDDYVIFFNNTGAFDFSLYHKPSDSHLRTTDLQPYQVLGVYHVFPDSTAIVSVNNNTGSSQNFGHFDLLTNEFSNSLERENGWILNNDSDFYFLADNKVFHYDYEREITTLIDTIHLATLDGRNNKVEIVGEEIIISIEEKVYLRQADGFRLFLDDYRTEQGLGFRGRVYVTSDQIYAKGGGSYFMNQGVFESLENIFFRIHYGSNDEKYGKLYAQLGQEAFGYMQDDEFVSLLEEDIRNISSSQQRGDNFILESRDGRFWSLETSTDRIQRLEFLDTLDISTSVIKNSNSKFQFSSPSPMTGFNHWLLDIDDLSLTPIGLEYNYLSADFLPGTEGEIMTAFAILENGNNSLVTIDENGVSTLLHTFPPGSGSRVAPNSLDSSMYYRICTDALCQLWVTDGSVEGTSMLTEYKETGALYNLLFVFVEEQLYYLRSDEENGGYIISRYDIFNKTTEEYHIGDRFMTAVHRIGEVDFGVTGLSNFDNFAGRLVRMEQGNDMEVIADLSIVKRYEAPRFLSTVLEEVGLAVLKIEPFGNELYYIHEDGTLELIFDLNPGVLGMSCDDFRNSFTYGQIDNYLYFVGEQEGVGSQIWRFPLDFLNSDNDINSSTPSIVFDVFPNPTSDVVNVSWHFDSSSSVDWKLISATGQFLKVGSTDKNEITLVTNQYPSGLYYIAIESEGKKYIKALSVISSK